MTRYREVHNYMDIGDRRDEATTEYHCILDLMDLWI